MSGKFQIIWIDNLTVRRTNLAVGENIIGNIIGTSAEYELIDRPAAKITVHPNDEIFITPYDGISGYVKNYGALKWRFIKSNWSAELRPKDTCLLFPVKIWLRVLSTMDEVNDVRSPKRKLEEIIDDEPVDKRCRSESNINVVPSILTACTSNHEPIDGENFVEDMEENDVIGDVNHQDINNTVSLQSSNMNFIEGNSEFQPNLLVGLSNPNCEVDLNLPMDSKTVDNQDYQHEQYNINNEETTNIVENTNISNSNTNGNDTETNSNANTIDTNTNVNSNNTTNQPTTSNTPPRDKCKYAEKCYRINSEHKAKFSHPGDPDYDIPDSRPECPYGSKCYRKNPQHKLDYKHTRLKRQPKKTRSRSPIDSSDLDDSEMDESVDESDYDPSFIDDSDLEEFETDYEDENN